MNIFFPGTFLLIYFIAMFACGIPIFFQEVATGQYLGSGGLTMIGQLVPILQGVGYATMTIVFFLDIYYCIIIAWTLFYLINSFVSIPDLPWGSCGKNSSIFGQYSVIYRALLHATAMPQTILDILGSLQIFRMSNGEWHLNNWFSRKNVPLTFGPFLG